MKTLAITLVQVAFYIALARGADWLVGRLHLPIPGSIAGIAILFVSLKLGIVKLAWIERGASWLLGEMLLFFIPAAVGIVNYRSLVANSGWQIALTIVLSTAAVMACSGWIGERIAARRKEEAKEC
ncbi:CidA/LrgA family protein [Cohnella thermotolerans]|uniref:CidA/LrgA family protein n=1 Tax=Cohnella thermotolerans TaxID=329858 RepID=UPI0003FD8118|nr:CidA/LrgA family holin-like protein [Cohnella thermotolerans]